MEQENNMQTDVQETVAVDAPATENVETQEKKHTGFTSKIGFVLAAAGSAVGLGNLVPLPGFGDLAVLYLIGAIATLIGAIVFMCTKKKFIYNI